MTYKNYRHTRKEKPARDGGLTVTVRDGNLEKAMRIFKKKVQKAGVLKELKMRKHYVKVLLGISISLLVILNVIALQIWFDVKDIYDYLDAIYLELSICEDLTDEYILPG